MRWRWHPDRRAGGRGHAPEEIGDTGVDPGMNCSIASRIPFPPQAISGADEDGLALLDLREERFKVPCRDAGIPGHGERENRYVGEDALGSEEIRDGTPAGAEMSGRINMGSRMGMEGDGA